MNCKGKNKSPTAIAKNMLFVSILFSLIFLATFYSDLIKGFAFAGLRLCAASIVPNLFPFMIFPDLLISLSDCSLTNNLGLLFEKITGIRKDAFLPFICGTLCGFPSGALMVSTLYENNLLDRGEATHIVCLSTTPSIAFCCGIGSKIGSSEIGVFLWILCVLSALVTSIIFNRRRDKSINVDIKFRQKFNFVDCIKRSGLTVISISAFITFFSVLIGLIEVITDSYYISLFSALFLEVGCAAFAVSESIMLDNFMKLTLIAFSLSFSGLSVLMQIKSVMPTEALNTKLYFKTKLFQALLSAAAVAIYLTVIHFLE